MKTDAKLTPVRAAHRFDEIALSRFLQDKLEGYSNCKKQDKWIQNPEEEGCLGSRLDVKE